MPPIPRPLDPTAVASADDQIYAAHAGDPKPNPLFDAAGNRLKLDATDPGQEALREEWRGLYLAGLANKASAARTSPSGTVAPPDSKMPVKATTLPCGLATPKKPTCPKMEIEINKTPDAKDDLVMLKSDHPPRRPKVKCQIKATGAPASTVVLTNPDGRLRFPEAGDKTVTLNVPADGSWMEFEISGEAGSQALNDAVIEAHCETATGPTVGTKAATVFWFDKAKIDIKPQGKYKIVGPKLTTGAAHAVDYFAEATIKPDGVDCTAPQVKDLMVGIMQNALAGVTREWVYGTPTVAWASGTTKGTTVIVPTTMRTRITRPTTGQDTDAAAQPLYDQPGLGKGTLDANSLKPPMGCAGGGTATSWDRPATGAMLRLTQTATDSNGDPQSVTWSATSVKLQPSFLTWAVIYDVGTKDYFVLRERGWRLNVDALAPILLGLAVDLPPDQAHADAADRPVTVDPVLSPFATTQSNDAANQTTASPDPAITTTIINPAHVP